MSFEVTKASATFTAILFTKTLLEY